MKVIDLDMLKTILTKLKAKIPSKTSQLTNDSNYIVKTGLVSQTIGSTSGTEVAKVAGTSIYAPNMTVTANYTSGTLIATINGVKIYMP